MLDQQSVQDRMEKIIQNAQFGLKFLPSQFVKKFRASFAVILFMTKSLRKFKNSHSTHTSQMNLEMNKHR